MASKHGQKTVEREHVFNNQNTNLTDNKARGKTSLCLGFILMALVVTPSIAMAQSNDFSSRLNRLENELETLNRAVYNGEKPPQINNQAQSSGNNQAAAQKEIRLQQIETQMRELTGRIEEQVYTINQLKQDVINLQAANQTANDAPQNVDTNTSNNNSGQMGTSLQNTNNTDLPSLDWKGDSAIQGSTSVVTTGDATALYESAYTHLKNKNYSQSREEFQEFLSKHPNHVLSANSKYWLGETYYVEGDFTQAARTFAQGFQSFPDSSKSPDMLLKLGLSLSNSGKKEEACIALSQLPVRFKVGPQDILDRGVDEMDKLGCSV